MTEIQRHWSLTEFFLPSLFFIAGGDGNGEVADFDAAGREEAEDAGFQSRRRRRVPNQDHGHHL